MKKLDYFWPTFKEPPKEAQTNSHKLLLQGGYIHKSAAGIYSYLPLGNILLENIKNIIRVEMKKINSHEILMPIIQSKKLWDQTNRWDAYGDELIKFKDRHNSEFALAPTHEEVITTLIKDYIKSYKNLPVSLFQMQVKFRDEIRPRFGLMRAREFMMKDAYSFHKDIDDLDNYYLLMEKAYHNILNKLELNFCTVSADNGEIGGSQSTEFMVISDIGEDEVFIDTKTKKAYLEVEDSNKNKYKVSKTIEVAHIFKLNKRYSKDMKALFLDSNQTNKAFEMGCYGIGISRLIMAVAEQNMTKNVFIWPESIRPFNIWMSFVNHKDQNQINLANEIYKELKDANVNVFYDNSSDSFGSKNKNQDFLGTKYKIIIGRDASYNIVEFINKENDETKKVSKDQLLSLFKK